MARPLLDVLRETYDRLDDLTRLVETHNCYESWPDPEQKYLVLRNARETLGRLGDHLLLIQKTM